LAPEDRLARNARKRAWAEVGTRLADSQFTAYPSSWTSGAGELSTVCESASTLVGPAVSQRFLLWVDAVGGYLVCLADQVVVGQAVPGSTVDIPILADLSRQHARICRVGDGYVIEPLAAVRVAGKRIEQRTLLGDGDELELGNSVRLRFRQPHPLSATARLEFLSRHRSQPSADGVLLMAESCVLGPGWRNHVVCREWQDDVVLYRQDGELYCRCMEPVEIDGQLCDGKGRVPRNARICGEKFAMSLEAV
ncbi:MAG: FHA domain-containing protein, partial [Pirellulaceae bacterium]|nr:FHA domain-containing protein [Pirellulaceae bacterium]